MNTIFNLAEIFACIIDAIFLFYFVDSFLSRSSHFRWMYVVLFAGLAILITLPSIAIWNNLTSSVIWMLTSICFVLVCFESGLFVKISVVLLYNIIEIAVVLGVHALMSYVLNTDDSLTNATNSPERFYFLIFTFLPFLFILYFIRKYKYYQFELLSKPSIIIAFIFFLCDFTIVFFAYFLTVNYYSTQDKAIMLCADICILMLITTGVVLFLLYREETQTKELMENEHMQLLLETQTKQLEKLQRKDENVKFLRHDLKNYLLNYRTLLDAGNVAAVKADINKRLNSIDITTAPTYSKNQMLDYLLFAKKTDCDKSSIKCEIYAEMPSNYENIEMMVILSNLIDNAIEAELLVTPKQRLISIDIHTEEKQINFVIRNRIKESVLNNNSKFHTTKTNKKPHGIGLKSVKHFVEINNGMIDIFEEEDFFGVHIIHNMED